MIEALDIHVQGIVQGVGFRPFVYRMAKKYLITGWVLNAVDGVHIHAEGESNLLDEFVLELSENAPAAAQVSEIDLHEVPLQDCETFEIRFSEDNKPDETTLVSPELATCSDCVQELFNPNNRRFRYPFINCTNCGPRFTIIDELPYDRANTSMNAFSMCERCAAEYSDPMNRRFHAQPNACFDCGPHVSWYVPESEMQDDSAAPERGISAEEGTAPHSDDTSNDNTYSGKASVDESAIVWGTTREKSDTIFACAVKTLLEGKIVAVKGLGGFHLVCDARNSQAVANLRRRKLRGDKPFAVMMSNVDDIRTVCEVDDVEAAILEGSQRPIVLLRKRVGVSFMPHVADGLSELGVMLPYTPVQHILMHDFAEAIAEARKIGTTYPSVANGETDISNSSAAKSFAKANSPSGLNEGSGVPMLVMTSGNMHDEPIVVDDAQAYIKLGGIADAFLGNDRPIRARFDDSVVRVIKTQDSNSSEYAVQFIRRARGYAPLPIDVSNVVHDASDSVLFATGPEQKNTFTLLRGDEAFISQHIGDMEDVETYDAWLEAKQHYEQLFEAVPQMVACDMHPEYLTSKWAHDQSLPVVEVQHHHAHIVSVMAEHGFNEAVCGIAFDGTGYGVDGAIWGGEVLLANLQAFERFANFAYVPMPGGAAAIEHPLRMAYGVLWAYDLLDHPGAKQALASLGEQVSTCEAMIDQGINTPMTSSVGRLFDAASALLGICTAPTSEGEGAVLLEACMSEAVSEVNDTVTDTASNADERYAIAITKNVATTTSTAQDTSVVLLDAQPTFLALLDDYVQGVSLAVISQRFHDAFVGAIVSVAELVRALYDINTVVLSGGVFMNRYLVEHVPAELAAHGFTVAINRDLPPNDGSVSFGQAVVAINTPQ